MRTNWTAKGELSLFNSDYYCNSSLFPDHINQNYSFVLLSFQVIGIFNSGLGLFLSLGFNVHVKNAIYRLKKTFVFDGHSVYAERHLPCHGIFMRIESRVALLDTKGFKLNCCPDAS